MRENKLRRLWTSGGAAVNGWLAIPNSFSAETMAHQGWDSLTIDLQHGVVDYQAMVTMLQAISTTDTVPGARALARARHPHEGARRRRLRRHLPDGQHARRRPEPGRLDALRAARHAQLRPGARDALRRRRLPAARQRDDRHAGDDRDRQGARQPRRHPLGRGARRDLHRPVGPVALARLQAGDGRPRAEGRPGGRPHPRAREGARRRRRHPQRQPRVGAEAHRQGLPVRHRELRRPPDGGRRAAGDRQDARGAGAGRAVRTEPPTVRFNRRNSHEDRIHRPRHHGCADGASPRQRRPSTVRQVGPQGAGEHRLVVGDSVRRRGRGHAPGRGRLHHGARHARRRVGAVRRRAASRRPCRRARAATARSSST